MALTDEQWQRIVLHLPPEQLQHGGRQGRPWKDARAVLDGVLWILHTGAQWHQIPRCFPPYQTCHRRFQGWVKDGTFLKMVQAIAADLRERGKLDSSESFIDGSFASAKKGGPASARPSAASSTTGRVKLSTRRPVVERTTGGYSSSHPRRNNLHYRTPGPAELAREVPPFAYFADSTVVVAQHPSRAAAPRPRRSMWPSNCKVQPRTP